MRENPLSVEEGQKIGYETVIRIAHTREEIKSWGNAYGFRERCLQSVAKNLIELKPLEWYIWMGWGWDGMGRPNVEL
jgi:hypothetical protein